MIEPGREVPIAPAKSGCGPLAASKRPALASRPGVAASAEVTA